jgi:hypothetical protein
MHVNKIALTLVGVAMGWVAGCSTDRSVEPAPVPAPGNPHARIEYEQPKPLPDQSQYWRVEAPEPPFDDVPLVTQRTPEQGRFEQAYRGVGKPRITVFVNRTLEGEIVPTNGSNQPSRTTETIKRSTGAVSVEGRDQERRYDRYVRYDDRSETRSDRFQSQGPAEYRETTRTYLRKGQYDEVRAKAIDYEAMENILTDFLACQGAVEIMSPTMARQKLSSEQISDLQSGKPRVLREIAQQLDADVLVQVSARPTRQTPDGLEVRLVGEAVNIKGGQQVGRAVVDIPAPLDKPALNKYTRFVARKLMMDMTQAWVSVETGESSPRATTDEPQR